MRALKITLGSLAFLMAFILLLLLAVLQWPGLILNPATMNWGAGWWNQGERGSEVRWSEVKVDTSSRGLLANQLRFQFSEFCYRGEESAEACFDSIDMAFSYRLLSSSPGLTELGPVQVLGGRVNYKIVFDGEESGEGIPELPRWAASAEIKPIHIEVDRYELQLEENSFAGKFMVQTKEETGREGPERTIETRITENQYGRASLSARSHSNELQGPWSLAGDTNLRLPGRARLISSFGLDPKEEAQFSYHARVNYTSPGPGARLRTEGTYEPGRVAGALNGRVDGPVGVGIQNCRYSYRVAQREEEKARADFNCPVNALLAGFGSEAVGTTLRRLELENAIGAVITASLFMPHPPSPAEQVTGEVKLIPNQSMGSALAGSGSVEARFAFVPEALPEMENLEGNVDLYFALPDFQQLVGALDQSPFPVPAPIRVLEGNVRATARGQFGEKGGEIRTGLHTRLRSEYQRAHINSDGRVQVKLGSLQLEGIDAELNVSLHDIRMALPPVGTAPPEQIFPDTRIRRASLEELRKMARTESGLFSFPFTYTVNLRTPEGRPLQLLSEFSPTVIPVALNFRATDEVPLVGSVEIDAFPLEVLGVRRSFEGAEVFVRATERQQLMFGEVELPERDETVTLMNAPRPGEPFLHPFPQLPLSLSEIVSGIAVDYPVILAVVDSDPPLTPRTGTLDTTTRLEVRRRW